MKQMTIQTYLIIIIGFISCNKSDDLSNTLGNQDSLTYYSQNKVDSILNNKMSDKNYPDIITHLLGRSKNEDAYYLVMKRSEQGNVERHEQWDDVAVIRSGHGILKTGYNVTGDTKELDKNWTGGMIQDANKIKLSPGDFIVIPAMMAHQYIPDPGDTLIYWTIKVKRTSNSDENK